MTFQQNEKGQIVSIPSDRPVGKTATVRLYLDQWAELKRRGLKPAEAIRKGLDLLFAHLDRNEEG